MFKKIRSNHILENLLEFYRKADGNTKKKILGCIFAEKLVLENGKVAIPMFTGPVQLILKMSKTLEHSDNKNDVLTLISSNLTSREHQRLQLNSI